MRAPSFSKWPPILGWMGPVGPLYCNPRLNAAFTVSEKSINIIPLESFLMFLPMVAKTAKHCIVIENVLLLVTFSRLVVCYCVL